MNQNFKIKKSALNRCISVYHRVGAKKNQDAERLCKSTKKFAYFQQKTAIAVVTSLILIILRFTLSLPVHNILMLHSYKFSICQFFLNPKDGHLVFQEFSNLCLGWPFLSKKELLLLDYNQP